MPTIASSRKFLRVGFSSSCDVVVNPVDATAHLQHACAKAELYNKNIVFESGTYRVSANFYKVVNVSLFGEEGAAPQNVIIQKYNPFYNGTVGSKIGNFDLMTSRDFYSMVSSGVNADPLRVCTDLRISNITFDGNKDQFISSGAADWSDLPGLVSIYGIRKYIDNCIFRNDADSGLQTEASDTAFALGGGMEDNYFNLRFDSIDRVHWIHDGTNDSTAENVYMAGGAAVEAFFLCRGASTGKRSGGGITVFNLHPYNTASIASVLLYGATCFGYIHAENYIDYATPANSPTNSVGIYANAYHSMFSAFIQNVKVGVILAAGFMNLKIHATDKVQDSVIQAGYGASPLIGVNVTSTTTFTNPGACTVTVTGDGTGAVVQPVFGTDPNISSTYNKLVRIRVVSRGSGYTTATINISGGGGTATATANLLTASPTMNTVEVHAKDGGGAGTSPYSIIKYTSGYSGANNKYFGHVDLSSPANATTAQPASAVFKGTAPNDDQYDISGYEAGSAVTYFQRANLVFKGTGFNNAIKYNAADPIELTSATSTTQNSKINWTVGGSMRWGMGRTNDGSDRFVWDRWTSGGYQNTPLKMRNDNGNIEIAGSIGMSTGTPNVRIDLGLVTDAVQLPKGSTAARPGNPQTGMIRWNTDNNNFEGYSAGTWKVFTIV